MTSFVILPAFGSSNKSFCFPSAFHSVLFVTVWRLTDHLKLQLPATASELLAWLSGARTTAAGGVSDSITPAGFDLEAERHVTHAALLSWLEAYSKQASHRQSGAAVCADPG